MERAPVMPTLLTQSPPKSPWNPSDSPERTLKASTTHWGPENQSTRAVDDLRAAAGKLRKSGAHEVRPTYVYFIRETDGPIKIGYGMAPLVRLQGLQVGNPRVLYLLSWVAAPRGFEGVLHRHLADHRVSGEWYAPAWQVFEAVDVAESIYGPTHRHECGPCARELRLIEAGRDPFDHVDVDPHRCGTWPLRDFVPRRARELEAVSPTGRAEA